MPVTRFPHFVTPSLVALSLFLPHTSIAATQHSAVGFLTGDPIGAPPYQGTSHPAGPWDVNVTGGTPGFLNGTSGPAGQFTITPLGLNTNELLALSIHVTDSAGPSTRSRPSTTRPLPTW